MNTDVQNNNVGAASEVAVVAQDLNEISFAEKAKAVAYDAWNSIKEFSQEIWEDEEGRELLKDLGIAIGIRIAARHPLTAGIAIGVMGCRIWQEIKAAKEACANN